MCACDGVCVGQRVNFGSKFWGSDWGYVHVTMCVYMWSEGNFWEQVWGVGLGWCICDRVCVCVCGQRVAFRRTFGGQTPVVRLAQQTLLPAEPSC